MIPKQFEFTGKLLDYKDFLKYSDNFIETGCAAGDGVQRALDVGFKKIISCEAAESWFKQSSDRFLNDKNVLIVNALSKDFLGAFVSSALLQVIFLDAHPSGPLSAGHADWVKNGDDSEFSQDNIIKKELSIILDKFTQHVIIIDDVNGLADGHAKEYMEIILKANPDYKFEFYDENLSCDPAFYYKDKILVAIP